LCNVSALLSTSQGGKNAKTDSIEMKSEDLFVSTKEIRVHYRFINNSELDIVTQVAFPVPDITIDNSDANIAIPTEHPQNILGFTTTVNSRPVATKIEQRVFADGIDQTEFLQRLDIPLAPHLSPTRDALDRLPRSTWNEFTRLGLAEIEEYGGGDGIKEHLSPRWTLKTTFYWQQLFPAHKDVVIEHRYLPSVGGSAGTMVRPDADWSNPAFREYQQKYCLDRAFVNAAAVHQSKSSSEYFTEQRLEYILTTGANWSKPIGEFRLVVDKGTPDDLVSFCGSAIKKISPTQFEILLRNFRPTENLYVLIMKHRQAEPDLSVDRSAGINQGATAQGARTNDADLAAIRRGDYKCPDLWYMRNNLFKVTGYCFKTPQAIRTFGNVGCAYDNQSEVPLSGQQQSILREIQDAERTKGCLR
jgi:Domain of unknown function (DUF4424)/YARHG domain